MITKKTIVKKLVWQCSFTLVPMGTDMQALMVLIFRSPTVLGERLKVVKAKIVPIPT